MTWAPRPNLAGRVNDRKLILNRDDRIMVEHGAADFVLNLGCLKTDMNFGNRPPHIIESKSVWAVDRRVDVKYHSYINVGVRDFVKALRRQDLKRSRRTCRRAVIWLESPLFSTVSSM